MDMFGIHHLLIVCAKGGECAHSKYESHYARANQNLLTALFVEVHVQGT
jgi:hypothetical protein